MLLLSDTHLILWYYYGFLGGGMFCPFNRSLITCYLHLYYEKLQQPISTHKPFFKRDRTCLSRSVGNLRYCPALTMQSIIADGAWIPVNVFMHIFWQCLLKIACSQALSFQEFQETITIFLTNLKEKCSINENLKSMKHLILLWELKKKRIWQITKGQLTGDHCYTYSFFSLENI